PGIQNVTLAKTVLERGGAIGATVVELPIGQHVAALAAGQIDGAYTLEPTGTIGRMNGTTRVLEAGVISKYVLGDNMAPWFGGSASLSSDFIKKNPEAAKKFVAAYGKGVAYVRSKPVEARQYMKGYTPIEGPLTSEVPLAAYTMFNEFTPADVAHFQKFFDLFAEKGIFSSRLMVGSMLYKG
ncbi:MAG: ABC transporter substrate-binding protein, partial [Polaromonas sp.]|nr:ABC transporter substrate-binding protein [Polaromonas sp.]